MDAIQKSLSDAVQMFHDRMSIFEADLQKSPATSSSSTLAADYHTFKSFIKEMLSNLQQQVEMLSRNVDNLEMRSRRKILLLHGVAELEREDTNQVVTRVVSAQLRIPDFTAAGIKRCHRMGRLSSGNKPRPILVKFSSMEERQKIWFAKTNLKGSGVTVSEFLTKSRHLVFMSAREKFGVNRCWTRDGSICISCPDGSRHNIISAEELKKIELKDTPAPAVTAKNTSTRARRVVTSKK